MKVSEINLDFVCQYLNINSEDVLEDINFKLELESYISAAKSYLLEYTQLSIEEVDEKEYLVIPTLLLISNMYENKSLDGENYVNQTFKSFMWLSKKVSI